MKQGLRNGRGRTVNAGGNILEIDYKDHRIKGKGVSRDRYGNSYEGEWKDDEFNGIGI